MDGQIMFKKIYRQVEDEYHLLGARGSSGQRAILIDMISKLDTRRDEINDETNGQDVIDSVMTEWQQRLEDMPGPRFLTERYMIKDLMTFVETLKSPVT